MLILIKMNNIERKILNSIALCFMLISVSSCDDNVPAVSIYFADHNMGFFLVGSDNVDLLTFHGVKEEPEFDPVYGAFVVSGEGELWFLELVIQYSPKSITVNGVPVNLSKEVSFNRVVYEDGTVREGDINMPH